MAAMFSGPAAAQGTIKIGEMNSYKVFPAFLEPYKKGWELHWRKSMPPACSAARSKSSRAMIRATRARRLRVARNCCRAKTSTS